MPLEVITILIPITDDMSVSERASAKISNDAVSKIADTLRESPMNEMDKGDRKIVYTLTADIEVVFKRDVQIIPL